MNGSLSRKVQNPVQEPQYRLRSCELGLSTGVGRFACKELLALPSKHRRTRMVRKYADVNGRGDGFAVLTVLFEAWPVSALNNIKAKKHLISVPGFGNSSETRRGLVELLTSLKVRPPSG